MAETNEIGGLKTTVNSGFTADEYGSSYQNIERDLFIMERMAKAVKKPEEYFQERVDAFKQIAEKARKEFDASYKAYVKKGLSKEEAKKRGESYVNTITDALIKNFNAEYPASINDLTWDRLSRAAERKSGLDF